jgi:hypothetical protein
LLIIDRTISSALFIIFKPLFNISKDWTSFLIVDFTIKGFAITNSI